ncbi:MAG: thymidylate kinase [Candidatus Methanomethylophilaceae archaeon]|nr:thymidylate kinase [Candidatus Methanomethylophilaceae archaeon]
MTWYVVDGMDGCGKSTIAGILKEELESKGRKVLLVEHPNRDTVIGRMERRFLEGDSKLHEIMSTLFYIMDVVHSLISIRGRRCAVYDDIVFVRYSMAVAYLSESRCRQAYDIVCRILPIPDVMILVDIDPKEAMSRILSRGEELEMFETEEKLTSVRRRMLSISDDWKIIDNNEDVTFVREHVRNIIGGVRS